jgi:hypothetical protein
MGKDRNPPNHNFQILSLFSLSPIGTLTGAGRIEIGSQRADRSLKD